MEENDIVRTIIKLLPIGMKRDLAVTHYYNSLEDLLLHTKDGYVACKPR